MSRPWQLLIVCAIVAALAAPGYSRPGGDKVGNKGKPQQSEKNEGKGKKGKKGGADRRTTTSLGEIAVIDDRILDVTGVYTLTTGTVVVILDLVQDDRGQLLASADVALPDGLTTEVDLRGRLRVTGRDGDLSFKLEGCVDESSGTVGGPILLSHTSDDVDDECTTSVRVLGEWDGSAFGTEICITTPTGTICYDLRDLVPINLLRGVTVGEATDEDRKGKGTVIFSERLVELPWGTETVRSHQVNTPKGFMLLLHGDDFNAQFRGDTSSTGSVTVESAKINLGYGKLDIDPEDVELPAVQ